MSLHTSKAALKKEWRSNWIGAMITGFAVLCAMLTFVVVVFVMPVTGGQSSAEDAQNQTELEVGRSK